jgi:hypothetical protein
MRLGCDYWKVLMKLWLLASAAVVLVLPLRASDTLAAAGVDNPFPRAQTRSVHDEVDPKDRQSCFSMGQISVTYDSGEAGPPKVGLRITDPRGRKIGYDPQLEKGWQELPLAQGFVDCDEDEDSGEARHCTGVIEICGPISGTYKVEVLARETAQYSIRVSGISQETRDARGFHSTDSRAELKSEIQKHSPEVLLLKYSREAGTHIELLHNDQHVARRQKSTSGQSEP